MVKINNWLQGFQNNLPGMKDFRHASRLYIDDNYKLVPKQKFMFHVYFETDQTVSGLPLSQEEQYQLNMLVKSCEMPRFGMNLEEKIQYNKKMYTATRIQYEPVNITFHDDHADTVTAFWQKYYQYMIADSVSMSSNYIINQTKDTQYNSKNFFTNKFGLDTPAQRQKPYLKRITIFLLHKQRFTSMTLINPIIGSFAHDTLDNADGTGVLANTMQVYYETVLYDSGTVNIGNIPGFATINYDKEPSPLTVFGRGSQSIFGPGGVVDGVGSVIKNVSEGNWLGAILGASNTYNNAKKIKNSAAKEELKGLAKKGIQEIGKQAGSITNPVGNFAVGAGAVAALALATPRGLSDNKSKTNVAQITTPKIDTKNFLTADEGYKLVTSDASVKDEIAAGLYYKDIGSRKNLTVSQSDVEFSGSSDSIKNVYRSKSITDVRKLITDGYIRINRTTQDVSIVTEKAAL